MIRPEFEEQIVESGREGLLKVFNLLASWYLDPTAMLRAKAISSHGRTICGTKGHALLKARTPRQM